jgi:hypothetical protein
MELGGYITDQFQQAAADPQDNLPVTSPRRAPRVNWPT